MFVSETSDSSPSKASSRACDKLSALQRLLLLSLTRRTDREVETAVLTTEGPSSNGGRIYKDTAHAGEFKIPATFSRPRQTTQTCYAGVYIIVARGTFESQDNGGYGLQSTVVDGLLKAIPNSDASAVVYPASVIDYGTSVQTGAINAQKQIVDYNKACPSSKIVLLGYSQGAQAIGSALAGGGVGIPVFGGVSGASPPLSQDVGANVVALSLLGDPNRTKGQGTDLDPTTCSTSSSTPRNGTNYDAFQYYSTRLGTWCHQGDLVCCSDGSDPFSHVGYLFSSDNVSKMVQWVVDRYNNGPVSS